ncbi:MAG TPA: hypothetical protein DEF47_03715 [Herpetosiphon sp.]|uniref:Immunity protein 40 domain-containing protein n=1 Tax=Herpetosiphon aurantiacus (strain ATCC 23779 / DSM 785 / 114-95) TaxID=316274 RepID=A9B0V1_HERA2|nr:Imm40 family immunity protein [Herpetosiphon sp.]ABX03821.1 hypothetical protein Haur_1173 [Herpetosiphon aurantiacus DSM 785]HBW48999.1 hypothetical protein [Herpetosiphon sp.]
MLKNRAAYNAFLSQKGILLSELGTQEYALDQQDAMNAIVIIEDLAIPILGGDVYLQSLEGIEISYENWSINRQPGESLDNYVRRSCAYTRNYIARFPVQAEKLPLFVLVLASDLQMLLP